MSLKPIQKRKVAVAVLCGSERDGWPAPWLTRWLLHLPFSQHEIVVNVFIERPISHARNVTFAWAREQNADYLLSLDNDTIPAFSVDDLVAELERHPEVDFASGLYPTTLPNKPMPVWNAGWLNAQGQEVAADMTGLQPGWQSVDWVGAGCLIVRRSILDAMPAPFNERIGREDLAFCAAAKEQGFRLAVNTKFQCSHLHSQDLLFVGQAIAEAHRAGMQEGMAAAAGVKVPEQKSSHPQRQEIPVRERVLRADELLSVPQS